jgi:predicted Zn-dependent peptidase
MLQTSMNIYNSNSDITLDDINDFYNSYYYPSNIILIISGDFNISHAKILIKQYFGNWKEGKNIKSTNKLIAKKSNGIQVRFIESPDMTKPSIRIANPAVAASESGFLPFYATFHILGKGHNSRIYNSIKSIPGDWDDNYWNGFAWERTYNYIIYQYSSSYKDVDKVYDIIINEIKNIKQNNITSDELEMMYKREVGSKILGFEEKRDWNKWVINELNVGITFDNILNWNENLHAITLNDVNSAGDQYWDHENFYLIIFGNKDSTATFLKQFDNVEYYQSDHTDH